MATKQELEQFLQLIRESDNKQKCPVKYTLEVSGNYVY